MILPVITILASYLLGSIPMGLILTKLDGTAKGGVVVGIVAENKMPVKFVGVGEQIDDMEIFNSEDFVKALI